MVAKKAADKRGKTTHKARGQRKAAAASRSVAAPGVQQVAIAGLKPHPRNYRDHPDDQLEHIKASIEANGFGRSLR